MSGHLEVAAGSQYYVKLYQYHPTRIPTASRIEVRTPSTRVRFLGHPTLALDSRYDHKNFRFEITSGIDAEETTIDILQIQSTNDEYTVTFELPIAIASGRAQAAGYTALVAALLATPHFTAALSNQNLSGRSLALLLLLAGISSIGAALVAVFKIRRIL